MSLALLVLLNALPAAEMKNELEKGDILEGVIGQRAALIVCGEAERKREATDEGSVVMTFTVDPALGTATMNDVSPDSLPASISAREAFA